MKYRILYKIVNTEKEAKYEEKLAIRMFDGVLFEYSKESGAYCIYIGGEFLTEDECRKKMYQIKQRKPNINIFLQNKERW